jgi:hypothetical protein
LQRGWFQKPLDKLSELSVRTIQRVEQRSTASVETWKSQVSIFNPEHIGTII